MTKFEKKMFYKMQRRDNDGSVFRNYSLDLFWLNISISYSEADWVMRAIDKHLELVG